MFLRWPIDVADLCERVKARGPHFFRGEIAFLGEGNRNLVFGDSERVIRVGKSSDATEGHRRECVALNVLSSRLSIDTPAPICREGPSACFPFGALLSKRVGGEPLSKADSKRQRGLSKSAASMAVFLRQLHSVPCELLPKWLRIGDSFRNRLATARRISFPSLSERISLQEFRLGTSVVSH